MGGSSRGSILGTSGAPLVFVTAVRGVSAAGLVKNFVAVEGKFRQLRSVS